MPRARLVHPDLFTHELLHDTAVRIGVPQLPLIFLGLVCSADEQGRFEVRPRRLKADIAPYDEDLDMPRCIDALVEAAFVVRYSAEGREYAVIPSFRRWQRPHPREAKSKIPPPPGGSGEPKARPRNAKGEPKASPRQEKSVGCSGPSDVQGPSGPSSPSGSLKPSGASPSGDEGESAFDWTDEDIAGRLAGIRAVYPRRAGDGGPAEARELRSLLEAGVDPYDILKGADFYAEDCRLNDTEERFVKKLSNWLRDRDFEAWQDQEPRRREESPGAKVTRWLAEVPPSEAARVRVLGDELDDDPFAPPPPVTEEIADAEVIEEDGEVEDVPPPTVEAPPEDPPEVRARRRRDVLVANLGQPPRPADDDPTHIPSAAELQHAQEVRDRFRREGAA